MKITIHIFSDDLGDKLVEQSTCGNFESATEQLGKMERRYEDEQKSPIRENYEDDHDCKMGPEHGCDWIGHLNQKEADTSDD